MAFSYSDKNFTVVGNLCFTHIYSTTKGANSYMIPPAIADRMLCDSFKVNFITKDAEDAEDANQNIAICTVNKDSITFNNSRDISYVIFFFPIDSNK